MYTKISFYDFRDAFVRMGRGDQFSSEALSMIYDYMEELDSDWEMDIIAICCDFAEESPRDIARSYNIDISECDDRYEVLQVVRQYLQDETTVIDTTEAGDIVYIQF